ncbi:MAG: hypothetical protein AAF206_31745 [Bacteroidota bacterium]
MRTLIILHLLSTLMMTGVIWFVQIVHYPLFAEVGPDQFTQYEGLHVRWTGYIVGPLMLLELGSGLLLFLGMEGSNRWWIGGAMVALGLIWLSTFFLQVPLHGQISQGFDLAAIKRLVSTNWIRTILWSLRAGILLYLVSGWLKIKV